MLESTATAHLATQPRPPPSPLLPPSTIAAADQPLHTRRLPPASTALKEEPACADSDTNPLHLSTAIRRAQDRVSAAAAASAAASVEMQASLQHLHQLQEEEEQRQLRERLKQTEQQQQQQQYKPRQPSFESIIVVRDDDTPPSSPCAFKPHSGQISTWLDGLGEGGDAAAEAAEVIMCMTCDTTNFTVVSICTAHVSCTSSSPCSLLLGHPPTNTRTLP
jgi:hypothetical protein